MKKLLLIFIFSIILISGCCKDQNPHVVGCQKEKPEIPGPFNLDSVKPYLFFNPGSYWIYECDATGELDSQVCVSSELFTTKAVSVERVYDYENIVIATKSLKYNETIITGGRTGIPDAIDFNFGVTWERNFGGKVADVFSTHQIIDKPFGGTHPHFSFFRARQDKMSIGSKLFHDILIYEVEGDPTFPRPNLPIGYSGNSFYYWAKNVGLIKIEHTTLNNGVSPPETITLSWNLVKYQIQ